MLALLAASILSSIAAMAWTFHAARRLEQAAEELEERVLRRLAANKKEPAADAAATDKGTK